MIYSDIHHNFLGEWEYKEGIKHSPDIVKRASEIIMKSFTLVKFFIVSTLLVIAHTAPAQVQRGSRCKQVKDAMTQEEMAYMQPGGEIDMERRARFGSKKCVSEQGGEVASKQRRRGQGGEIDYALVQGVAKMAARWITNELKLGKLQNDN